MWSLECEAGMLEAEDKLISPCTSVAISRLIFPLHHHQLSPNAGPWGEAIKVSIHTPGVLTSDDLYSFFSEYGKITSHPKIKEDGTPNYVYINFSSCESAREASRVANRTCNDVRLTVKLQLDEKPVRQIKDDCQRCSEAHPPTAHSVVSSTPPSLAKPLPTSSRIIKVSIHTPGVLTSDDLYGFFSEYGKITCYPEIKEDGTPNYVYINFSSCESAREASRVTNHTCNDVRLTVKLDKKPVKENKTHKVKDTDKLVSFLLTKPPFLQEAEDIAQQHDLSVKLMKNEGPGLLLIGSQISSQAMSQIDGLVDQIKQYILCLKWLLYHAILFRFLKTQSDFKRLKMAIWLSCLLMSKANSQQALLILVPLCSRSCRPNLLVKPVQPPLIPSCDFFQRMKIRFSLSLAEESKKMC